MSDLETAPAPDQQDPTLPPPTAESPLKQPPNSAATTTKFFSIWPPDQRTRDAVINRLIQTFSTPSVLSNRYGTLSPDEASAAARKIEDEAFSAASASPFDDSIEILHFYSKEISKRMLDTLKARAPPNSSVDNGGAADVAPSPAAAEDAVPDAICDS